MFNEFGIRNFRNYISIHLFKSAYLFIEDWDLNGRRIQGNIIVEMVGELVPLLQVFQSLTGLGFVKWRVERGVVVFCAVGCHCVEIFESLIMGFNLA